MHERFRDPLLRAGSFVGEVLVRCPVCDQRAVVLGRGAPAVHPAATPATPGAVRRLRCASCGLARDARVSCWVVGAPVDPFFRLPLWLRTGCRGHLLWAYNPAHLDLLESWVAARLRERGTVPGSMSMVERLPAWITAAKHRDDVLAAIRRLRSTLPEPALPT